MIRANLIRWGCAGLIGAAVLLLASCGDSTEPELLVDRITMPTDIQVNAGDHFAVPVYVENDAPVAAVAVPLQYANSVMRCDSVSFIDSRCSTFLFQRYFTRADTIYIGLIDTIGLAAGKGLMATLHFWAFGNAPDTEVVIDLFETPVLDFGYADTSLVFGVITPQFQAGRVRIKTQL